MKTKNIFPQFGLCLSDTKNKCFLILFLFIFIIISGKSFTQENDLIKALKDKEYSQISSFFEDETYKEIERVFSKSIDIKFELKGKDQYIYYAKYPEIIKIGKFNYTKKDEKYSKFHHFSLFDSSSYINKITQYDVIDKKFKLGEAVITFKKGKLYRLFKGKAIFVFTGDWDFFISPSNEEECMTLERKFKNRFFKKNSKSGVFLLNNSDLELSDLKQTEIDVLKDDLLKKNIRLLNREYGYYIDAFKKYCFIDFASGLSYIMFFDGKKDYYKYIHNLDASDDIVLMKKPDFTFILSYSSLKKRLIFSSSDDQIKSVDLNFSISLKDQEFKAKSNIKYKNSKNVRKIDLDKMFQISEISKNVSHVELGNSRYFYNTEMIDDLNILYHGPLDLPKSKATVSTIRFSKLDQISPLYRGRDFFPTPANQNGFFSSNIKIGIPRDWNCISTGQLVSDKSDGLIKQLEFRSENTKRLSMVFGKFEKRRRIEAATPVNVYKTRKTGYSDFMSSESIKNVVNLLSSKFGKLNSKEMNLIIRKWDEVGGLSNKGFIMMDITPDILMNDMSKLSKLIVNSPVDYSREVFRDIFSHELSHQWWGHTIAADSYKDMWIMEGGATFSSLLYYESVVPQKTFMKTIERRIKNWVLRYSNRGPLIYGPRVLNLGYHKKAYQSLVYNKAALVYFMLREILGEEPFFKLLRKSFEKFKYQMVNTKTFINFLAQKDARIYKFFNNWIYSRKIPSLKINIKVKKNRANILFVQRDTDFVFPLELQIKTKNGVVNKKITINSKVHVEELTQNSKIKQILVKTNFSPVKIELIRKNIQ